MLEKGSLLIFDAGANSRANKERVVELVSITSLSSQRRLKPTEDTQETSGSLSLENSSSTTKLTTA